jgi:Fic family protein
MVHVPEKPPSWRSVIESRPELIAELSQSTEVNTLISKADARYYYWDKIRVQPLSSEINKSEVWAYLRFLRHSKMKQLPLKDREDNSFTCWLPDELQSILHQIDRTTAESLQLTDPRNTKRYSARSLMEEAITSSQIEGAVATIRDAKKMLLQVRRPRDLSEQMIYNNYRTMQSIKEVCSQPLDHNLLWKIHSIITHNTLDDKEAEGRYRRSDEPVRIETTEGEILFEPPLAEEVAERMEALFVFANDSSEELHPVVKAMVLHFTLAYIHPFIDGNGRMARALFYWYLIRHDYWLFEYVSISPAILKRTSQYARAYLYSELDEGDLTYFLHFHARIVLEALDELKIFLERDRTKRSDAVLKLERYPDLNLRQAGLIQRALTLDNQLFSIKEHQQEQRISYQTARSDLLQLDKVGLLRCIRRGKTLYFIATEDLADKLK